MHYFVSVKMMLHVCVSLLIDEFWLVASCTNLTALRYIFFGMLFAITAKCHRWTHEAEIVNNVKQVDNQVHDVAFLHPPPSLSPLSLSLSLSFSLTLTLSSPSSFLFSSFYSFTSCSSSLCLFPSSSTPAPPFMCCSFVFVCFSECVNVVGCYY